MREYKFYIYKEERKIADRTVKLFDREVSRYLRKHHWMSRAQAEESVARGIALALDKYIVPRL